MKFLSLLLRRRLFALIALLASVPALAANYPLELVSPRAAGTAPSSDSGTPSIPAGHRIFRAYPGIAYNIRAVVIAGAYPYTFALSNAPSGMTINATTGEINWPNPQASATPTITVTDAEGTRISSPWTIDVTTAGFKFVDSNRGSDSNAGTLAAPWATLSRVRSAAAASDIVYFRTGTYNLNGMTPDGQVSTQFQPAGNWQAVEWGSGNSLRWLAYPGESPVYDAGYRAGSSQGSILRMAPSGAYPAYLEGFRMTNMWHMGIQYNSGANHYPVFRNLVFNGPSNSFDGSNSSGIMTTTSGGTLTHYAAFQRISQTGGAPGLIKHYSHKKHLWEELDIRNSGGGPDQKMNVPRFEIRRSVFVNTSNREQGGIFGNMQLNDGSGERASGEIRFNLVDRRNVTDGVAVDLNQNSEAGTIHVYRNTLIGRARVRNADSTDGPFRFYQNVIINNDSGTKIYLDDVTAPARVVAQDNLLGTLSTGVVDALGQLTGSFSQYVGSRGHMLNELRPMPPQNLRAE